MEGNSPSSNRIKISEAITLLGIPKKSLENLIKSKEIPSEKSGRFWTVLQTDLERWKSEKPFRIISLEKEDYVKCLNFSIESFYGGFAMANFGSRTQRDAGQFLFNSVQGKLAEIAVKKFLQKHFDIDITLDFDVRGVVIGQDITEVKQGRVINPPRIRVGIKATKERNMFLPIPQNEVILPGRSSDVYILVRVALPTDHFLRFVKSHADLQGVQNVIPDFSLLHAEIAGFVNKEDLQGPVTEILGQKMQSPNYYCLAGELKKTPADWKSFIERL